MHNDGSLPQEDSMQGKLWAGEFGNEYVKRSGATPERIRERLWIWTAVLRSVQHVLPKSALEIGPNVGLNLIALAQLMDIDLHAIEPNDTARAALAAAGVVPPGQLHAGYGDNLPLPDNAVEMAFTSGVMIHIAPENLLQTYREMHRVSSKYLVTIEYFSDQPETISYRGHERQLFRRDFGAVWREHFSDVELVDYGFFWKGVSTSDSTNWWLFRKR